MTETYIPPFDFLTAAVGKPPAPDLKLIADAYDSVMNHVLNVRNDPLAMGDMMGMLIIKKGILSTQDYLLDITAQARLGHLDTHDLDRAATAINTQGRVECVLDMIVTNMDETLQKINMASPHADIGTGTRIDVAATAALTTAAGLTRFLTALAPATDQGCATLTDLHARMDGLTQICQAFCDKTLKGAHDRTAAQPPGLTSPTPAF
ncbi:MAG: hypothetical protein V4621_04715 [Pseudomonadota bacterium]